MANRLIGFLGKGIFVNNILKPQYLSWLILLIPFCAMIAKGLVIGMAIVALILLVIKYIRQHEFYQFCQKNLKNPIIIAILSLHLWLIIGNIVNYAPILSYLIIARNCGLILLGYLVIYHRQQYINDNEPRIIAWFFVVCALIWAGYFYFFGHNYFVNKWHSSIAIVLFIVVMTKLWHYGAKDKYYLVLSAIIALGLILYPAWLLTDKPQLIENFRLGNYIAKTAYLALIFVVVFAIAMKISPKLWVIIAAIAIYFMVEYFKIIHNIAQIPLDLPNYFSVAQGLLPSNITKFGELSLRFIYWAFAYNTTLDNPIFGVGVGMIRYAPNANEIIQGLGDVFITNHPHLIFVELASEAGLPALAIFMGFCAMVFWRYQKNLSAQIIFLTIILSAMISFSVWSFWYLIAASMAMILGIKFQRDLY